MAFTIHGYHIPGSELESDDAMTEKPANCGGPNLCDVCSVNVTEWQRANDFRPADRIDTMMLKARILVANYVNTKLDKTDRNVQITHDQVYLVWFSKTLQNWKAMASTTIPDGMYYELTYNGDAGETYLDAYKKLDNVRIPD